MNNPPEAPEGLSLSRWSRRKLEVARAKAADKATGPALANEVAPVAAPVATVAAPAPAAPAPAEALPPVESLTIDSDFRGFLAPNVDEGTKRAALKKLFSDPHFNVMDGLDIYIDDYTKPDPMPEGMLAKIADVYNKVTEDVAQEAATPDETAAAIDADSGTDPEPADTAVAQEASTPPPADEPEQA